MCLPWGSATKTAFELNVAQPQKSPPTRILTLAVTGPPYSVLSPHPYEPALPFNPCGRGRTSPPGQGGPQQRVASRRHIYTQKGTPLGDCRRAPNTPQSAISRRLPQRA
eukprot:gene10525-biopygen19815